MAYSQTGTVRVGGLPLSTDTTKVAMMVNMIADHGTPMIQIGNVARNAAIGLGRPLQRMISPCVSRLSALFSSGGNWLTVFMVPSYWRWVSGS